MLDKFDFFQRRRYWRPTGRSLSSLSLIFHFYSGLGWMCSWLCTKSKSHHGRERQVRYEERSPAVSKSPDHSAVRA